MERVSYHDTQKQEKIFEGTTLCEPIRTDGFESGGIPLITHMGSEKKNHSSEKDARFVVAPLGRQHGVACEIVHVLCESMAFV